MNVFVSGVRGGDGWMNGWMDGWVGGGREDENEKADYYLKKTLSLFCDPL